MEVMSDEQPTRESLLNSATSYMIEALAHQGIEAVPVIGDYGKALAIADVGQVSMENLADRLIEHESSEWEAILHQWVNFVLATIAENNAPQPSKDEVLGMIRTRIISTYDAEWRDYGRVLAPGLLQVLCLDHPTHVVLLSDEQVEELDIPLEVLFTQGQINTDAEPIDEVLTEDGVSLATSDSLFMASKIGNIPALLDQLGIEAPDGLLFAVPNRSLLLFRVPIPDDGVANIFAVAQALSVFLPESGFNNPGGLVSENVYYWSPNGTIEPQLGNYDEMQQDLSDAGHSVEFPDQGMVVVKPGPMFIERFGLDFG